MRIGVNCLQLTDKIGGVRQYFQRLFRELLTNDQENTYVFFFVEQNRAELEQIGNNKWQEHAIQVSSDSEILQHLMDIDLLFCPFSALWPRPVPIPTVMKLPDIQEQYYPQFFSDEVLRYRKLHYAPSTRAADVVITVSEYSRRTISEHHGISPDKIHVAYLAPDEAYFVPPVGDPLATINIPDRFVFYTANHWQHKNHDVLLRALLHLRTEHDLIITCVLTGYEQENGYPLKDKVKEYDLQDQVTVLGYVSNEQIRALYHRATLLCFPSLFEGFGMPVVEAMAAGCPVACANVTSIPEVGGDAVLYFNPNDHVDVAEKMRLLWNNEGLRLIMADAGRKRSQIFTLSRMAEVHRAVFKEAVSSFNPYIREVYRKGLYEPMNQLQLALLQSNAKIAAFEKSLSWRVTAPLRMLMQKIKGE